MLMSIYAAGGILLAFLALPLLAEKIPPNGIYGFRVRDTLENREFWYAVNKFAARRLIWSGATISGTAIVLYLVPALSMEQYALACLAVFAVAMAITLIQSFRYLGRLKRRREPL